MNIQKPGETEGVERLRGRVMYHLAQLKATKAFEGLEAPTQQMLDRIDGFIQRSNKLYDDDVFAVAAKDRSLRSVKRLIRGVDSDLLSLVDRKRKDVRYTAVYDKGNLTSLMATPYEDQPKAFRTFLQRLNEPSLQALKDKHGLALAQALDNFEQAVKALEAMTDQSKEQSAELGRLRGEVTLLLERHLPEIAKAHPHDDDEVALYFRSHPRLRRSTGKAEG